MISTEQSLDQKGSCLFPPAWTTQWDDRRLGDHLKMEAFLLFKRRFTPQRYSQWMLIEFTVAKRICNFLPWQLYSSKIKMAVALEKKPLPCIYHITVNRVMREDGERLGYTIKKVSVLSEQQKGWLQQVTLWPRSRTDTRQFHRHCSSQGLPFRFYRTFPAFYPWMQL